MSFGEYLKNLREERNLSVRELARRSGVSIAHISQTENGHRGIPKPETLKKLAEGLNHPIEDLMSKAGYLDDEIQSITADKKMDYSTFADRLNQGMKQKGITPEQAAEECGVTPEYIRKLMHNPDKLPGVGTLYKLAELIDVTPDYLGGYTDDPNGRSPHTPKPKELTEFLENEHVMFHGVPLNDEDKQKIENVLIGLFWEAKQMNKRKKK